MGFFDFLKKDAEAYNHAGNVHYTDGDYDKAIASYTKAIEMNPLFTVAYVNRADAYAARGNRKRAVADYTKAIELEPDYALAYFNRGLVYLKQERKDKAMADYKTAVELNSDYGDTYLRHMYTHHDLKDSTAGDGTTVINVLSVTKDIKKTDIKKNIPMLAATLSAVALFVALIVIGANKPPDEPKVKTPAQYVSSGCSFFDREGDDKAETTTEDKDAAIADYTKTIEANPKDAAAYFYRASLLESKGDIDKAIADFTKAIEVNPRYAEAYFYRATFYMEKRNYDKAIADFTKTIELMPDTAEAYYYRAECYAKRADTEKTVTDMKEAARRGSEPAQKYLSTRRITWLDNITVQHEK
ncbi:tetratricopeptide repeat protein [Candidatus Magnetomonas plexicatena]|uniref:tetratricopeptide repeat protein n=1 Tax=Candidatus Magnetomonas plexicatena TaxID=2552947 RepID=UPI001C78DEB8|nr:DUF3808 domain-containing protein [Nitrospirales bacterium LBB_01]